MKPYTEPDQGGSQQDARQDPKQNTGFLHAAMRYTSMAMALPGFVAGAEIAAAARKVRTVRFIMVCLQ